MNIDGNFINYVQYGNNSSKDIVLLHGWGQNIEMMDPIGKRLEEDFKITIIDLPGFGKSPEPDEDSDIFDYYELLNKFLLKLKITNPIMIGHSFGGRLAILYASLKPVDKLVLFASPFRPNIKKDSLKLKIFKLLKKIPGLKKLENFVKSHTGSSDYRNASPIMRQVLVNTINQDLSTNLPNIKASTLLIWGSNDTAVSLEEAKYIESNIKDAGLIVYEGCTHYAYLERLDQTISILYKFLKGGK